MRRRHKPRPDPELPPVPWLIDCQGCGEKTHRNTVGESGLCIICELYGPEQVRDK